MDVEEPELVCARELWKKNRNIPAKRARIRRSRNLIA
jgi:hypothetical protein